MMWWWGAGNVGPVGWVGMAFTIVFWIAVVVGIIYLVRYLVMRPGHGYWHDRPPGWSGPGTSGPGSPGSGGSGPRPDKSDALRILEERYARGEIDQEDFQRRKADLTS